VAEWEPALEREPSFAGYVRQLDAWRRIPFHDPGLPAEALPADWPGEHAWAVFGALEARGREPALAHARTMCSR
jgi:phenylacetic acid degradation operon negative regulatory protein